MRHTLKFVLAVITAIGFIVMSGDGVIAAEISTSHEFAPVEWNFGGEPVPETYWTPWLPLGTQQLTRFKFGVRASMGAIAVKCPVKVTFTYDPAKVKSGGDVPVKVKMDMLAPAGGTKTFESAFGISLPNKLQLGFFGISGVPDLLPWIDIPYNLWEAIGKIPKYGSYVESAVQNIGVNTSSDEALPLGSVKAYHDERTLFSFDLSELAGKYKNDIAVSLYNKLSDTLGPYGMGELLTMISLTKNISTDDARGWLTDLCGSAVEKLGGFTSIELMGDPSFSVEGVGVRLNFRAFIPGGKGSGSYVMTFNRSGQEQTFTFRDVTPFIEDGDKLVIVVDSIGYDFKLKQKLVAKIKIAVVPVPIDSVEKTVAWTCPTRNFTESDFKIELPVTRSTDIVQSLRVNPGTTSAMVSWTSPSVPLKGTVIAYNASNNKVKEISEGTYKNAHNVVVTGLQPTTNYRFVVECLNTNGEKISAGEVSTTTTAKTTSYLETLAGTTLQMTDTGTATAGTDYIDFQWTTNNASSTEVIMSPSPDLTAASFPVMKKTGGTIQGWGARGGTRVYETNHVIRATELEPGTKYYYLLRSIMFEGNDETKSFDMVGHLGEVTTQPLPPPPSIKIKAQFGSNPLAQIPVVVKKTGGTSFRFVVNTGQDGFTPSINLEKGGRYTFSVENNLYFQDITSSPIDVSASATGEQSSVTVSLVAKPSPGAYVFNTAGQPISGATVKIRGNTSFTATTDATGLYKFSTLPATGNIELEVSKSDYATKRVKGRIDSFSGIKIFSADNATLESAIATLTITVKQPSGAALNNVSVKVKEGGTVLGTVTTNAQGTAAFTYNFGDNNSAQHFLTITAEKTGSSLNIAPNSTTISVKGGTAQSVDISCLVDTAAPTISGILLEQVSNNIFATFTASEQGQYFVEIKNPGGQASTTIPWTTAATTTIRMLNVAGPSEGLTTGGIFKFNIKFRDTAGNESQTGWMDIDFVTAASWNIKANAISDSTAVLSWKKFPHKSRFTRYEILKATTPTTTGGTVVTTIADINTTSYRLTNLEPITNCRYLVKVPDSNTPVGAVEFTTGRRNLSPVISNFTVTPVTSALNEDVNIVATISDPDSNIEVYKLLLMTDKDKQELKQQKNIAAPSAQVSHTFKPAKAGKFTLKLTASDAECSVEQDIPLTVLSSERPVLKFVKAPSGFEVNKPSVIALDLANKTKVSGQLEFSINWGDGQQQNIKAQAQKGKVQIDKIDSEEAQTKTGTTEAKHAYGAAGEFTVTVNATLSTEEKTTLTAEPIIAAVTVTAKPTEATLAEDKTKSTDNQKYFNIKASGGSYKVTNWTITYGDSRSESGTGDVDKQVNHNYAGKGDYEIEFTVTDAGNNEIKKLASVRIRSNAAIGGGAGSGTLQQVQTDTTQPQQVQTSKKTTTGTSKTMTRQQSGQTAESGQEQLQEQKTTETKTAKQETGTGEAGLAQQQQATKQTDAVQAEAKPSVVEKTVASEATTTVASQKTKTAEEQVTQKQPVANTEPVKGDITLTISEIKEPVYARQKVTVNAAIKNDSQTNITGCKLKFYIDSKPYGSPKTFVLQVGETRNVDISFTSSKMGASALKWELVAPENFVIDSAPENNVVERSINVLPKPAAQTSAQLEQKIQPDTQTAQETKSAEEKMVQKQPVPKIDIKKISLGEEIKGLVPPGSPLTVLAEVNASDDFAGPFTVNVELKRGQEKQKFTETIDKLGKGSNSFKWDLKGKPEEGSYILSVEMLNSELKLKDKTTKTFRVGEKKTVSKN